MGTPPPATLGGRFCWLTCIGRRPLRKADRDGLQYLNVYIRSRATPLLASASTTSSAEPPEPPRSTVPWSETTRSVVAASSSLASWPTRVAAAAYANDAGEYACGQENAAQAARDMWSMELHAINDVVRDCLAVYNPPLEVASNAVNVLKDLRAIVGS